MTPHVSQLSEATMRLVAGWSGRTPTSLKEDLLGLILEQSADAQTTEATPDVVAELVSLHSLDESGFEGAAEAPMVAETEACAELLTARGVGPLCVPGVRVRIPDLPDFNEDARFTLLDLYDELPRHWMLVGGQMIHLHCWQRGRRAPRVTTDADIIINIRAKRTVLGSVTKFLQDRGFEEDGRSPANVGHRWKRRRLSIDVLIPEGLSEERSRARTITGARTVQVPGGTQAIARAQTVEVDVAGRVGRIIRPSLLGALVGKAASLEIAVDPVRDRHSSDFATLASLIDNPAAMSQLVTPKDRLRAAAMLGHLPATDPAWRASENGEAARGMTIMAFGLHQA